MNYISDILYWISTGLLVPDIVLLIFFFGRSLLLIGSFFGQYLSIRRTASLIGRELDGLTPQTVATLAERLPKKNPSLLVVYLNRLLGPATMPLSANGCLPISRLKPTATSPPQRRSRRWAPCSG